MMLGYRPLIQRLLEFFFLFFGFSFYRFPFFGFSFFIPTDRPTQYKETHSTLNGKKRDGLTGNSTMLPAVSGLLSCVTSSHDEI